MSAEDKLKDTAVMPVVGKPPSVVNVSWAGERRFDAGVVSGGPTIRIDANRVTGPSPVDVLLCALGSCTSVDVVDILTKRRTPPESLDVQVVGERALAIPSRVTAIHLTYRITGADVDRVHAERAIDLAVTKYCSVRDSLDPNMPIDWTLILNGE
jgi:putative redox protein